MRITLSEAIEFVRARIDELSFSNDDMIFPADDDRNFDNTVEKLLPEAAEYVYRASPAGYLEPESEIYVPEVGFATEGITSSALLDDGSIRVVVPTDSDFFRFVSFKSSDSDVYVTTTVPFNSPEARMQMDPYTKGSYDAPVVVERKMPGSIEYTYYSVKPGRREDAEPVGFSLYKIDKPSFADGSIFCPEYLGFAVLNRLTGMVLDAYKETQYAQSFYQKSLTYIS